MNYRQIGLAVIEAEAKAILHLTEQLDDQFEKVCELLLTRTGRVVLTGMGKSGHIARKIASTFASVGTPAFFMHPGEASHGDLGMILPQDSVIIVSYSGHTPEVISLIPLLKRLGVPLIAITGFPHSQIAQAADFHLNVSIEQEACPLGLAPTTSTTASLVMGDALAITLLQARGFTADDFARAHPGGQLGKKLLLRVNQLWHTDQALPVVPDTLCVSEALIEVTAKKLGLTCVTDAQGRLVGVYTDGDIRRTLTQRLDIHQTPIAQVMTRPCKTIAPDLLAVEALNMMQAHSITALIAVDAETKPLGVVHLHDLLKAGVV